MVWIDLVIYAILLIAVIHGAKTGVMRRLMTIVAALLAFSESWRIAPWIRDTLLPYLDVEPSTMGGLLVPIAAFFALFLGLYLVGRLIASLFARGPIGIINRVAGAALGLVVAIYILGYAFSLVDTIAPLHPREQSRPHAEADIRARSKVYGPIRSSVTDLEAIAVYLREVWHSETAER